MRSAWWDYLELDIVDDGWAFDYWRVRRGKTQAPSPQNSQARARSRAIHPRHPLSLPRPPRVQSA